MGGMSAVRAALKGLTGRSEELARICNASGNLQRQFQECDGRVVGLEDGCLSLQQVLETYDARLGLCEHQNASLCEAATRRQLDLRVKLTQSEAQVDLLTQDLNDLMESDDAADALQKQLDASKQSMLSIEAAVVCLQSRLDDLQQRQLSASSWRDDREELRTELSAFNSAAEITFERVAILETNLQTLQKKQSQQQTLQSTADHEELDKSIEELERELFQAPGVLVGEQNRIKIKDLQYELGARECRLKLLSWRCSSAHESNEQLRQQLRPLAQKASELEALVVQHGSRLDGSRGASIDASKKNSPILQRSGSWR